MKKILIILFCFLISTAIFAQNEETLTNKSIIDMFELEFGSEVIISKIHTSKCSFITSLDALKELKAKKIPGDVIAAMIKAGGNANIKEEITGIFVINPDNSEKRILPTAFSATKTRTLASELTYGIASGKIKSVLNNLNSKNIIENRDCSFKFYFAPFKENQQNFTDWWFRTTTSPNEFVLVKLDINQNKKIRQIETGKANIWVGSDVGVDQKNSVQFEIIPDTENNGIFIVKPKNLLSPGEYCFFYQGTIPQGGYTNQSVFDFSVK